MKFLIKLFPLPIILALICIVAFILMFVFPYLVTIIISWIAKIFFGVYLSNLSKFIMYIIILAILILSKTND